VKYRPGATNVADPVSRAPQHLQVYAVRKQRRQQEPTVFVQQPAEDEHSLVELHHAVGVSDSLFDQVGCFIMTNLVDPLKAGTKAAT
jgi:hypothetical protein